jgi:hypothetical protein
VNFAVIIEAFSHLAVPHHKLYEVMSKRIIEDADLRSELALRDISAILNAFVKANSLNAAKILVDHLVDNPNVIVKGKGDSFAVFQISDALRKMKIQDDNVQNKISASTYQL